MRRETTARRNRRIAFRCGPARTRYYNQRMDERIASVDVTHVTEDGTSRDDDVLAVEEPLEIRIGDKPISVTMRTPGDDYDLAAGFLFTEGLIRSAAEIESIRHWGSPNVVRVALQNG